MSNFFDNPYYKLNKMFLSFLGLWPAQSSVVRCIVPFLIWSIEMSIMIPEIICLPQLSNDIDAILDCIPTFLTMFLSYAQSFNCCFNHKKMLKMINRLEADWKRLGSSPNIEIIYEYAARGRYMTKAYGIFFGIACMTYLAMPTLPVFMDFVAPLNQSRAKTFVYRTAYGVNQDDYYWPILIHAYVTTLLVITAIFANDVLYFAMIEHACGLFKIVRANLELVKKNQIESEESVKNNDHDMICHCANLHKKAIIFAELIETCYSACLVVIIGLCLILLSLSGVQTIMHLDEPQEALRYGSYSIAQIIHLYLNSIYGQKIMDYSLAIFDHAYDVNWYELEPRATRLLLIMMMRSAKPCRITAGKIYVVSMENYSVVMKTSISYFTVFSSMR